jgi:hypothetical protein
MFYNRLAVIDVVGNAVNDRINNNLLAATLGSYYLSRLSYNETTKQLTLCQSERLGDNSQDLSISPDGKHIAFPCGAGNGGSGGH